METSLLTNLSIILFACGIFAVIFHYLKLPLLLGYIVAGFIIGPNLGIFHFMKDTEIINHLSEFGVILLMFSVGLEFDLFKLKRVFFTSFITVCSKTIGMVMVGLMVAPMFHWSGLSGIFLGSLLAMGSTMMAIPILKDQNALKTDFAQCAISVLIMEDILAVCLLVLLSGIAVTGHFAWNAAWNVTFFLGVFVVMVFCIGKSLAPLFVDAIFRSESHEVLIVAITGTMLAVCMIAHHFGLSVALGAFIAGSILSKTHIADDIESLTAPLRDIFGAVFFATIGIMTDLKSVYEHLSLVLILSCITTFGQTFFGAIGLFLGGKSAETSFRASLCQAQIGEFSFVIASLGTSLGVVDKSFVSVTAGVAIGTIVLSALLNKASLRIFGFLDLHCPKFLAEIGTFYHNLLKIADNHLSKNDLLKIITKPALRLILWFFLLSGTLFSGEFLAKIVNTGTFAHISRLGILQAITWICAFVVCLPFLIGFTRNLNDILFGILGRLTSSNIKNERVQSKVFSVLRYISSMVVLFFFSGIFLGISAKYLPHGISIATFGLAIALIGILLWRRFITLNNNLERVFIESFNDKIESSEQKRRNKILQESVGKNKWPVVTKEVILKAGYGVVGSRILDVSLHAQSGSTIIAITRNGFAEYNPHPNTMLFPGDHVILLGEPSQIEKARTILAIETESAEIVKKSEFNLAQICIGNHMNFANKELSQIDFRKHYGLSVVGIQRGDEKIMDISAETGLIENDILLLTGSKSAVKKLSDELGIDQSQLQNVNKK